MATHSSTLAWKIPLTEEPARLQSMGSLGVGQDWETSLSLSCIGEGNGDPLQCSCLENPRDGGACGLLSLGSHRVGHDWSDLAAAAADLRIQPWPDKIAVSLELTFYRWWQYSEKTFLKLILNVWMPKGKQIKGWDRSEKLRYLPTLLDRPLSEANLRMCYLWVKQITET